MSVREAPESVPPMKSLPPTAAETAHSGACCQALLKAIADLAVRVDAIWPDHETGQERSFAWLIDKEFGK